MAHKVRTLSPRTTRIETLSVHAGREDLSQMGVHAPPIDLSSTYPITDLSLGGQDLEDLAHGSHYPRTSAVYSRLHNSTVARYEEALAKMEQANEAVAFSSGMAAVTACLLAARQRGRHVIAIRPLYGGTDHLLASKLLDLDVSFVEAHEVEKSITKETSLVIVETPANPNLVLYDIKDIVRQAGSVAVMVDNTFATPVLQNPFALGAQIVLHSATKYLGGHGDVLAGIVATNHHWATEVRKVRVITGNNLHPMAAFLLHRGLQTLHLRVRAAQSNAMVIAERLCAHPDVQRVYYPGLEGQDPKHLIGTQMRGPGAVISFEIKGGFAAASRLMSSVKLVTPAVSLGSADTLIQHPAALTHRVVDAQARAKTGINESLVRLSIGIEHVDDIWIDLEQALRASRGAPPTP